MSDYRCSSCNGYGISCTCYRHTRSFEEKAAFDIERDAYTSMEGVFRDWARGYTVDYSEYPYKKIPVDSLDIPYLEEKKKEYLLAKEWSEALSRISRAEGKRKHLDRQHKRALEKMAAQTAAQIRQEVLDELVEKKLRALRSIENNP